MIQWMHRLSKSFVATMLMGVLALSFVVWGVGDIFTGVSQTAVATVGGTNIEGTTFQRNYRNFLRIQTQHVGKTEPQHWHANLQQTASTHSPIMPGCLIRQLQHIEDSRNTGNRFRRRDVSD